MKVGYLLIILGVATVALVGCNVTPSLEVVQDPFSVKWGYYLDDYYPIGPCVGGYCYSSNSPPVVVDVTGDTIGDIFVTIGYDHDVQGAGVIDEGVMYALNGATGQPMWAYYSDGLGSHTCMSVHDLDGDGDLEILGTGYHDIVALHTEDGSVLWKKSYPANREDKPAVVLDVDGELFVYTCQNRALTGQSGLQKREAATGDIVDEAPLGITHPCHGGLAAADINNDGEVEIILTDRSTGVGVACYDTDLNLLWNHIVSASSHCVNFRDINQDGYLDVIVGNQGGAAGGGICVVNGATGGQMSGKWDTNAGITVHYTPAVYDIDKDGHLEVITCDSWVGTDPYAYVFDLTSFTLERTIQRYGNPGASMGKPPLIADVIGGSDKEMVFAYGAAGIEVFDSNYECVATQVDSVSYYADRMIILDMDGDGLNEIVALCHSAGSGANTYAYVQVLETSGSTTQTEAKDFLYSYKRTLVSEYVAYDDPDSTGGNGGNGDPPPSPTPGFELIFVLIALGFIYYFKRNKR